MTLSHGLAVALFNGPFRNLWPMFVIPVGLSLLRDLQVRRPAETRSVLRAHKILIGMPGLLALILAAYSVADYVIPGPQDHSSWRWFLAPVTAATILTLGLVRLLGRVRLLRHLFSLGQPAKGIVAELAGELRLSVRELEIDEPVCFVTGLGKPVVFLSTFVTSSLSREELRAVLLHERAHARARDPLWLFALALLQDCNPVKGRRAFSQFLAGSERLADLAAIRECQPADLASAVTRFGRGVPFSPVALSVADRSTVAWRLSLLLARQDDPQTESSRGAVAAAIALTMLGWPILQFVLCEVFCPGNF